MSPIIGKRAKDHKKKEGTVVWIGPQHHFTPRVVLLYDDGSMRDYSVTDVTILGPVGEGPYR